MCFKMLNVIQLILIIVLLNQHIIYVAYLSIITCIGLLLFMHTLKRLQFQDFNLRKPLYLCLSQTQFMS